MDTSRSQKEIADGRIAADPVDAMLARHGVRGPWTALPSTGIANRIYATADVVLRVATNHPDAVSDARTESVAAPLARAAGILTPRLIAFDDSRTLVERPFSLWERIHGETLGVSRLGRFRRKAVWREIGRQIALLHTSVRFCADPNAYLDTPARELNLQPSLERWIKSARPSPTVAHDVERLIGQLRPYVSGCKVADCFVHNDVHEMNIMCSRNGVLLGLLDWGDAGWGDPTFDFAAIPLDFLPAALNGYVENVTRLGECPEARFVWDRLQNALDDAAENPGSPIPIDAYRRILERH